jgi:TnpA family transposase
MYGYFKNTYQFFNTAHQRDVNYVANQLGFTKALKWEDYKKDAKREHQNLILSFLGFQVFDKTNLPNFVTAEITMQSKVRKDKKKCFSAVAALLAHEKVEIPEYSVLRDLIARQYETDQNALIDQVSQGMDPDTQKLIDKLFTKSKHDGMSETYRIVTLKRFTHKLRPHQIKKNTEAFDTLHELFMQVKPILDSLHLSVETIKHYATQVQRSRVFQITRKTDADRYLVTICFIAHQYFVLQDVFVDTLLASVVAAYNSAERNARLRYYESRHEQTKNINTLLDDGNSLLSKYNRIKVILSDSKLSDSDKVTSINNLVTDAVNNHALSASIEDVKDDQEKLSGEALLFHFLELGSKALQNRCNRIVERLSFSDKSFNKPLFEVITMFSKRNCAVDTTFPVGFMTKKEQRYVDTNDKFKSSLYKVILFNHMVTAIKGDGLHLKYSYKYLMLDDYMIPTKEFDRDYDKLVEHSNTDWLTDFPTVYKYLDKQLHAQYQETNEHILASTNTFISADGVGGIRTTHPRKNMLDMPSTDFQDIELYPSDETIPLSEVLSVADNASGFLSMLQHYSGEDIANRPSRKTMIAAIVCKGLHFTNHKFGKLCEAINNTSLTTAANNYVSTVNASLASDKVINFVDGMGISQIYLDGDKLYTSSDGQKYPMSVDSLTAMASFKYGGKDKVIVPYNFLDSRHLSIHSNVITGATREAHYMIDGVLNNEVVKSDMHVTDTHGFTEVVTGLSHLVGINYAPRIKNPLKQQMYSTRGKKTYSHKNYLILPKEHIKEEKIQEHWREILRMVVSLKLGRTTASQIFRRLNSYSNSNHPIYEALKAYGRIIKSLHLLRYIDDSELRVAMTKQLNKGESANKLDRALAIGRAEYHLATHEEQETMESCKRLIKNAIVCWNYMYLTKRYYSLKTREEKIAFINKVRSSSAMAWEHIMIHGAFDFSESRLKDSKHFDLDKMLDPAILKDIQ